MTPKSTATTRTQTDWDRDVAAMAGTLVHEIKNPLSTIQINTQLVLEDWKEPETPREERTVRRLRVVADEVGRVERIVQTFLRFTERHVLDVRPTSLNQLLEDLAETISASAERAGVRVRLGLESIEPIPFDAELVRQVFLNLVQNAQQAMGDGGGELIIRTRTEEQVGIEYVVGEVIDTGKGISETALEKIFGLYYSTRDGGNGFGLAISKRIVEEHGGYIEVQSDQGKGSRFAVYLPASGPRREAE